MLTVAAAETSAATRYREDVEFLAKHTKVLELSNDHGARIAICPAYQGRVMTSTCDGPEGRSFGWINREFITKGENDPVFNNYGGEDRFWLAPEAGQFALFFAHGAKQEFSNWRTPAMLNEGEFRVASGPREPFVRMLRRMQVDSAAETRFSLWVERAVRLVDEHEFAQSFGDEAASALSQGAVKWVGFETNNSVTNEGSAMDEATGLVSIWILGMFQPGPKTVIIVPYHAGDANGAPIVNTDYFGALPPERLRATPSAVLFRGDGQYRSKLGIPRERVKPVAGAIDFEAGVLTLVHFTLPAKHAESMYVENRWQLPQTKPYAGDVFNSYNDGPTEPGAASLGGFFELETLSPASPMKRGQQMVHVHRTIHVQGELPALARVAKAALGVDLEAIRQEFAR